MRNAVKARGVVPMDEKAFYAALDEYTHVKSAETESRLFTAFKRLTFAVRYTAFCQTAASFQK